MKKGEAIVRTTVIIITGLLTALPYGAQGQFRPSRSELGPRVLFYEAIPVPSSGDWLHDRVDIHYRIDREFFVPRQRSRGALSRFTGPGELLTAELADSTGGIAARSMHSLELTETDADRKPLPATRLGAGDVHADRPPGKIHGASS